MRVVPEDALKVIDINAIIEDNTFEGIETKYLHVPTLAKFLAMLNQTPR